MKIHDFGSKNMISLSTKSFSQTENGFLKSKMQFLKIKKFFSKNLFLTKDSFPMVLGLKKKNGEKQSKNKNQNFIFSFFP